MRRKKNHEIIELNVEQLNVTQDSSVFEIHLLTNLSSPVQRPCSDLHRRVTGVAADHEDHDDGGSKGDSNFFFRKCFILTNIIYNYYKNERLLIPFIASDSKYPYPTLHRRRYNHKDLV